MTCPQSRSRPAHRASGLLLAAIALALGGCAVGPSTSAEDVSNGLPSTSDPESAAAEPSDGSTSPESESSDRPTEGGDVGERAGGEYVDSEGFVIVFPDDWVLRTDFSGSDVIGVPEVPRDAGFLESVNVVVEDTGQPTLTLEEYLQLSEQNAPQLIQGFRHVELQVVGEVGQWEYTGFTDPPLHFLAYTQIKDGKAYIATYTASMQSYDEGLAGAREILESLRVS